MDPRETNCLPLYGKLDIVFNPLHLSHLSKECSRSPLDTCRAYRGPMRRMNPRDTINPLFAKFGHLLDPLFVSHWLTTFSRDPDSSRDYRWTVRSNNSQNTVFLPFYAKIDGYSIPRNHRIIPRYFQKQVPEIHAERTGDRCGAWILGTQLFYL